MTERAMVFPGQGAQCVGMGKDLAERIPAAKALFDRADEVLGYKLSDICFDGPDEALTRSDHCQPAIFVTSMACVAALRERGAALDVAGMAGLSLGEWSALHAAGALSFEDTLRVLEARGRFMQDACEAREGGMVSVIGLPDEAMEQIVKATRVEVANLNSEGQTVLSGERGAVEEAARQATAAGAKRAIVLNVAGAYHSVLMEPAARRLEALLADIDIAPPGIPVMANVTGKAHGSPDEIRDAMVRQVTSTVRWLDCVKQLQGMGVTEYLECGPGKVLSGLIKRIDRSATVHGIQDSSTLDGIE